MYLLLSELVSHFVMERTHDGHPLWIMYDT